MKTLEERFWSKVDIPLGVDGKPDKEKCWMWLRQKACSEQMKYLEAKQPVLSAK